VDKSGGHDRLWKRDSRMSVAGALMRARLPPAASLPVNVMRRATHDLALQAASRPWAR
jgi:hypothetical protein